MLVVVLLALPLVVYRAHSVRPRDANPVDRVVWIATRPIREGLGYAVEAISTVWGRYVDLHHARSELGRARIRMRRLEGRLAELEGAEAENRALRLLLDLGSQRPAREPLVARVIGAGFAPGVRTLHIDKGAMHGLDRGRAVVDATGLVGLVQRSGWTSSEVVLLIDPRLTVLARVARSRVSGRVRGRDRAEGLTMEDVSREGEVEPGDLVVTSGLGQVFPPDVPIGRVVAVESDGRRRRLEIDCAVDFERLDWVAVLPEPSSAPSGATPPLLRPPALWPILDRPDPDWSAP